MCVVWPSCLFCSKIQFLSALYIANEVSEVCSFGMVVIRREGGILSENQYCRNIDLVKGFGC